jgi:type VI secretion system protein ImpI
MFISLKVENEEMLPSGDAACFRTAARDFGIGRQHSDWTLPDPDRIISSRHCRIAYRDGAYWLHDLSRNGTFVNGARERLAAPYRLEHGDRLRIGRYVVRVSLDDKAGPDRIGDRSPPVNGEVRARAAEPPVNGETGARSPFSFADDPFLAPPRLHARQSERESARGAPSRPVMSSGPPQALPAGRPADGLLRAIADAAGIAPEILLARDARDVASEIGTILRLLAEGLPALLRARAAAKSMVKNPHRTMIGGADNNPLKFVPSPEEALEIMFSRRRPGYMDAAHSVEDAFHDLKTHEIATYAAMQTALARLLEDISPHTIENKLAPSTFMSKKARAWDALLAAWSAREEVHENGMLDVFLAYFSEAYADASRER